jgi:hypothetical protein
VRPEDRTRYLDSLEPASSTGYLRPFQTFLHERLDTTLANYLGALQESLPPS